MISSAFFQDESTKKLLTRSAAVAAVPMCLHGGDEFRILGVGGCDACAWVNQFVDGKQACRFSRLKAKRLAQKLQVPVAFVCHLGFACVILAPVPESDFTITFGPFIPVEADKGIEYAVRQGLIALGLIDEDSEKLPFSLTDIRIVPQGAIIAAAEWLIEGLQHLFDAYDVSPSSPSVESEFTLESVPQRLPQSIQQDHLDFAIAALGLFSGKTKDTFAFLLDKIEEEGNRLETTRTTIISVLPRLLETAGQMGADMGDAWSAYALVVSKVQNCQNQSDMLKLTRNVLRCAAKACAACAITKSVYLQDVVACIFSEYASSSLLTRIAASAGVAPSTISRMLERLTGVSFSGVVGHIRTMQARRLLRHTTWPVETIAQKVGIGDQSNFSKVFLRHTGVSPGAYRSQFSLKQ